MKPYIDIFIQDKTDCDRGNLLNLVRDENLGINANVVYIYSLADEVVNYPNKSGHVIYIGEAGRASEPTGKRFSQHTSTSINKGRDSGTIYSLSRYYWLGKRIRLQIFLIDSDGNRKKVERELLNAHVKEFGSLPICQGTTGSNYSTTAMSNIAVSEIQLTLFSLASNNQVTLTPQSGAENLNSANGLFGESSMSP